MYTWYFASLLSELGFSNTGTNVAHLSTCTALFSIWYFFLVKYMTAHVHFLISGITYFTNVLQQIVIMQKTGFLGTNINSSLLQPKGSTMYMY